MRKFFHAKAILILGISLLSFASCGLKNNKKIDDVSFDTVKQNVISSYKTEEEMVESNEDMIKILMDIPLEKTDSYYVSFSGNPVVADQITIIKLKDKKDSKEFVDKLKTYLDKRITTFDGYAPIEADKLRKSNVLTKGNFVVLTVSNNQSEVEIAFKDSFK